MKYIHVPTKRNTVLITTLAAIKLACSRLSERGGRDVGSEEKTSTGYYKAKVSVDMFCPSLFYFFT